MLINTKFKTLFIIRKPYTILNNELSTLISSFAMSQLPIQYSMKRKQRTTEKTIIVCLFQSERNCDSLMYTIAAKSQKMQYSIAATIMKYSEYMGWIFPYVTPLQLFYYIIIKMIYN